MFVKLVYTARAQTLYCRRYATIGGGGKGATIERGGKEEMIAGSGKGPMNTVGGKGATIAGGGKWCNECMRWL